MDTPVSRPRVDRRYYEDRLTWFVPQCGLESPKVPSMSDRPVGSRGVLGTPNPVDEL